jgi:hypothetical protein
MNRKWMNNVETRKSLLNNDAHADQQEGQKKAMDTVWWEILN